MYDLVTIGEVMAELRCGSDSPWQVGYAGDMFNAAYYARRALPDGRIALMTRLGHDPLSHGCAEFAASQGIATDLIETDETRNIGLYSITTDAVGERSFHYWRAQSAARAMFAEPQALPPARVILFSAITLAILPPTARAHLFAALRQAQGQGAQIAFDSNYRPALWESVEAARETVLQAWALADIALPSLDDELALFGGSAEDILTRFQSRPWAAGAVKRGGQGPISLVGHTLKFQHVAEVVDSTAAGDSFAGAYLAAYLQGCPAEDCLRQGHEMAAHVIRHPGAIVP